MKTHKLYLENNCFFAFEVDNAYIRPRKIGKLLGNILGVTDVKVRKLFGSSIDIHVQFKYQDKNFIVWEPYGDSSRYWFGPDGEGETGIDISDIERAFSQYKPPLVVKVFGDILTLNFGSLFSRS